MLKKMICLAVVLGLASSASALVIDGEVTWHSRTEIHSQDGGGIEVTATGKLTATARVDHDGPGWIIIRSGGQVLFQDQYKFPHDEQEHGPTVHIEGGGYMECADTESIGERVKDGGITLDLCGTFKTGNIGAGDRRDPRSGEWTFIPGAGADGIEITVEGDWATVHNTPEPATLLLLGLAAVMVRRKR